MKVLFTNAALAAAVVTLGVLPSHLMGQNPAGANAGKFGIAVVDVGYIFKNHQGFKTKMETMKAEMANIEDSLKGKREQIAAQEAQKEQYNLGAPEYKQVDETVARMKADFNLEMNRLRKDFLEREAKVYYQTFQEVDKAVTYYAKRQNIGLVLRFNGEDPDANRRDEILRSINKPVVFQNNIDITPDVLALLNRAGSAPSAPNARAAPAGGASNVPRTARPGSQIPGPR